MVPYNTSAPKFGILINTRIAYQLQYKAPTSDPFKGGRGPYYGPRGNPVEVWFLMETHFRLLVAGQVVSLLHFGSAKSSDLMTALY